MTGAGLTDRDNENAIAGFDGDDIGASSCSIVEKSPTRVVCRTPSHAAHTYPFKYRSNGRLPIQSTARDYTFSDDHTPRVTSVAPTTGSPGEQVL